MKLKLRNEKIYVKALESISGAYITYDYEINTNHLNPVLKIKYNDNKINRIDIYRGTHTELQLDCIPDRTQVLLEVQLNNSYGDTVRTYTGEFTMFKSYSIVEDKFFDIYEQLEYYKSRCEYLENEGEVI